MTAYTNINRFRENKKNRRFAVSSFIILNTRSTGDWTIIYYNADYPNELNDIHNNDGGRFRYHLHNTIYYYNIGRHY